MSSIYLAGFIEYFGASDWLMKLIRNLLEIFKKVPKELKLLSVLSLLKIQGLYRSQNVIKFYVYF